VNSIVNLPLRSKVPPAVGFEARFRLVENQIDLKTRFKEFLNVEFTNRAKKLSKRRFGKGFAGIGGEHWVDAAQCKITDYPLNY